MIFFCLQVVVFKMNEILSNWIGVPYLKKYIEKRVDEITEEYHKYNNDNNACNFYECKGKLDELNKLLSFIKKFQLGERI